MLLDFEYERVFMQRFGLLFFTLIIPLIGFGAIKLLNLKYLFYLKLDWQTILLMTIVAPILEEIIFRGLLQEWLQQLLHSNISAIILVNLLFMLLHYTTKNQIVYLLAIFFCGIIYSVVKIKQKSIIFPILLHAYYNLSFIIMLKLL